jgi:hypothetical protein
MESLSSSGDDGETTGTPSSQRYAGRYKLSEELALTGEGRPVPYEHYAEEDAQLNAAPGPGFTVFLFFQHKDTGKEGYFREYARAALADSPRSGREAPCAVPCWC